MNETTNARRKNADRILNLIIVDESGSMSSIYDAALTGMNSTISNIKSQARELSDTRQFINLITFSSTKYSQVLRHTPSEAAPQLTPADYRPSGCTPLYDAIGRAVTSLEPHVKENDAVVVTIITDGEENSSTDYSAGEIKRLIDRLSEKGWLFTFIGANQDVMLEAGRIGIKHSMAFNADSEGTQIMFQKELKARASWIDRVKTAKANGKTMKQIMIEENDDSLNFFSK